MSHDPHEGLTARQKQPGESSAGYAQRVAAADAALEDQARAVSRMLLGGIARQLSTEWRRKRLVIAAAGVLEYLPFTVLRAPDQTLLVAQHEIVTIPSASVLATLRRDTVNRTRAPRPLAILADPVFAADDPRLAAPPSATRPSPRDEAASRAEASSTRCMHATILRVCPSRAKKRMRSPHSPARPQP